MSSAPYEVQVLEKANYRKQHIVPYKDSLPPLPPDTIRVQTSIVALTTNNITYARLGDALNWYDAHPLPFKGGAFSDATKYGRTNAWGTAKVIDSNVDFVPVGSTIWGYLPLDSLPLDKQVKKASHFDGFVETTDYRDKLMTIYNRYFILNQKQADSLEYQAYAALVKVLFETSYAINRLVFGWDPDVPPVNPLGLEPPPPLDTWTRERASLRNATVVIMPASSKTAFAFAYALRHLRPAEEQPRAVVGVSSDASKPFCEQTKLFDHIMDYGAASGEIPKLASQLGHSKGDKIVFLDFGARPGLQQPWYDGLQDMTQDFTFIRVAGAIPEEGGVNESGQTLLKAFTDPEPNQYPSNASPQRDAGIKLIGESEYLGDLSKAFDKFLDSGTLSALKLVWGKGVSGPDGIEGGWNRLTSGKMGASEGLVYKLE